MKSKAGLAGRAPVPVQVGLQHGGRVVLGDTVQHHLHAGGAEGPGLPGAALVEQFAELFQAAVPVPPQGAGHAGQQGARLRRPQVGGQRVGLALVPADDRVLPAGDAQGQQVVLGGQQRVVPVVLGDLRQEAGHQDGRALLQHADGLTGGVPLDPAVRGVRGRSVDARQGERPAVHPCAVAVTVGQEDGPVGHDRIERLPRRYPAREGIHGPAAARDPFLVGVLGGVGGHEFDVSRPPSRPPAGHSAASDRRRRRDGRARPRSRASACRPPGRSGSALPIRPSGPGLTPVTRPPATRTQVPAGRKARPSKTVPLWKTTSALSGTAWPL